jgi:Na+/proline symporter
MMWLSVSAFIVFLPSFYYGMLAASDFSGETMTAVPMLAGKLMDLGGFRQFVAIISLNAVVAAIMSTADSTIIGGTNIWICTWVKGFLLPGRSGKT